MNDQPSGESPTEGTTATHDGPDGGPEGGPEGGPDDGFDPVRLRTIPQMRRSMADAMVGGVSTGAARYLNVDPIVVRIAFVVLTFIGGAGIIMYLAAWLLLPSDQGPSYAQDWFKLDQNEEQFRVGGLVAAGAIAVVAVIGEAGWGWGNSGFGWIIPVLALLALIFVLPRRRREAAEARLAAESQPPQAPGFVPTNPTPPVAPKEPRSRILLALTVSVTAIAMAVTRLVSQSDGGTAWTTYVAVALTIVALAILVSTFWGDAGWLIAIGLTLTVALAVGTFMPSLRLGQQVVEPTRASSVESTYQHGAGQFVLDLSSVEDPEALVGRTINIETGLGQTQVILPAEIEVEVNTDLFGGQIRAFDETASGTGVGIDVAAEESPHLTLNVEHEFGEIEVIRK